jgi:hypothetical protein
VKTLAWRVGENEMIADYLVELEKRIEALEKEIAELKVRASERPEVDVNVLAAELEVYRSKASHKTE